jgi:tetratricopeptide (TPR) repeat protein
VTTPRADAAGHRKASRGAIAYVLLSMVANAAPSPDDTPKGQPAMSPQAHAAPTQRAAAAPPLYAAAPSARQPTAGPLHYAATAADATPLHYAVAAADATPLLTYAATHHYPPVLQPTTAATLQKQIDRINFDLSKDPPPANGCAQTLGAKRFATLYDDLAQAYSNRAEHVKAVDAYAKAIDCNPRADFLHAELAASLLDLGRYADARVETQRQLHLGRADFTLYTLLTQLDFIDEHWQDAIANARIAATMAPNDEQATYWQCFLWLAQLQAGTKDPILAKRRIAEGWPAPILESLQGKITEAELVEAVSEEHDQPRQRDILSEALFYTGQLRLATHRKDEAVKYITATVNLKLVYFIEHQLATGELRKLVRPVGQKSSSPLM